MTQKFRLKLLIGVGIVLIVFCFFSLRFVQCRSTVVSSMHVVSLYNEVLIELNTCNEKNISYTPINQLRYCKSEKLDKLGLALKSSFKKYTVGVGMCL